jgi:ketosteroid isomerase-like protein
MKTCRKISGAFGTQWALAALVIVALGTGIGSLISSISANAEDAAAAATRPELTDTATKAVEVWVNAAASGDAETIRKSLAPEFQILRSDGKGYDEAEYIAGGMLKVDSIIGIKDVIATAHDDLMVVRYVISLKASAGGKTLQQTAPRLTVFRRKGDRWLVVAHANFAKLTK